MTVKIAYILGCTHSGTTLLHRVLGAHSRVMNLGSVKNLRTAVCEGKKCPCGAPKLEQCSFWQAIDEQVRALDGRSVFDLDPDSRWARRFATDNRVLFQAVAAAHGVQVVIDSSRRPSRLDRLRQVPGIDLVPIHLYKAPPAQVYSWEKRNQPRQITASALRYWGKHRYARQVARHFPAALRVSYEAFCQDPETETARIARALGLAPEPEAVRHWGENPIHVLGGNRMKSQRDSVIRLDEKWRRELTAAEQRRIDRVCGRVYRQLTAG
ncbi:MULTISPECIES: hypothetical protein [unclassified Halorhodospira]|uniref:hypothetical protein n=1 Tax=unclassified Halorhodospira TaxID=2626748 RepID=UPI001EE8190E|nr:MULTISPECIES: hypothetical protein [unclassified Halorhodospira]MCG5541626.1 hypothetical protein [Halorhodospira sp. M39old]MCG5546562.1 hypothetical protein [Halorhodospira sp. M38]